VDVEINQLIAPRATTTTGMYLLGQGVAKNEGMARHILKTVAK